MVVFVLMCFSSNYSWPKIRRSRSRKPSRQSARICGILRGGIRSANNNCAANRRQEGRKRVKSKYLRYPHFPLRFDPHSPPRTLIGWAAVLEDAIDSCAQLIMRGNGLLTLTWLDKQAKLFAKSPGKAHSLRFSKFTLGHAMKGSSRQFPKTGR